MGALLLGTLLLVMLALFAGAVRHGMNWGATERERRTPMAGDEWLERRRWSRVRMTRAIDIDVPAAMMWPWLAQMGRGAGWYSWDLLDNGNRPSARHLVSWIPEPSIGDATAIGYLRHLEPRRQVVWWLGDSALLGAVVRAVMAYRVIPQQGGDRCRLVVRIQGEARGAGALLFVAVFPLIDTIMACRQLVNLRARAEHYGSRAEDPLAPESGARDQFQFYQVIYAAGGTAGVPHKEKAERHRSRALADGVLAEGRPAIESVPRPR